MPGIRAQFKKQVFELAVKGGVGKYNLGGGLSYSARSAYICRSSEAASCLTIHTSPAHAVSWMLFANQKNTQYVQQLKGSG